MLGLPVDHVFSSGLNFPLPVSDYHRSISTKQCKAYFVTNTILMQPSHMCMSIIMVTSGVSRTIALSGLQMEKH